MSRSAAFFDLDRTLLRGASGPILSSSLRSVGVLSDRVIPGEDLVYRLFNLIGETRPSMMLAKQGARFSGGQVRKKVQEAGEVAAESLVPMVEPYALPIIEEHKAAGRPVVLATTSPYDMVKPFADALGLDDAVATRYGEGPDGRYDGTIDGHFVWGPGKLAAVREWADANDVDVEESYAYSDSFYDMPLLGAVAHPTVVNPDPRMRIAAVVRRWPIRFLDKPKDVPKFFGIEPAQAMQVFARPELIPYARFDIQGTEKIPTEGGAIMVANHRSYFDSLAMNIVIAPSGRPVRFLGKREVFDAPVVGQMAKAAGGIRVDRGTGSDEPLEAAAAALRAGELVMLMPEGTIPRGPAFFDPELKGRWGAAKLAAMAKVPVIPIGLWGTEQVWPRSARLPNMLNVTDPPLVTARIGDPVDLKYRSPDADTKRIMKAITDLLPKEAREPYDPTPEELMRTFPPGYTGDPEAEADRRPGSDT
ncbi:HAD-IB family hydrolase [Actinospongicola halichondriae]|uniref:HAD-IB family hydrolase n=1 Tax=Actinospongicola halichondriae TaxID=3236844 RepID=UPI003D4F637A